MIESSVQSFENFLHDLEDKKLTNEERLKHITEQCNNDKTLLPCDLEIKIENEDDDPEIDDFVKEVNQVATELYELLKDYPHWCNKFLIIHQIAPDVISWAKEYDYNGIRANGYWTLIKLAVKLARLVIEKYRNVKNPVLDENLELLLDYALIAVDVLKVLRKDSIENPNKDNTCNLITSDNKYFIELFGLLLSIDDKMVAAMYGRYCGFWLSYQSRLTSMTFVTALAIGSRGLNSDVMQCLYNPEYRGLVIAKLIKSADISFVKMMGSLMEWRIYKYYLPSLLYWRHSLKISEFHVKHQRNWFLSACNVKVMRFEKNNELKQSNLNKIRCRLYQNTSAPLNNKLIVHMHGGGYIVGSVESHDVYIQNWCSQLPGCSILSVDYSVSPEVKFPVALQQLLDVYLFVSSDNEDEIKEILGFKPEEFILAGDSAGGNLSMALCLVLNDINKHVKHSNSTNNNESDHLKLVKMPKSVLNLYAPYNLTLNISPSMILASCDSMISAGVMLSCFEAYLPLVNFNDTSSNESSPSTSGSATPTSESKFSLNNITRSIGSLISKKEKELEIEAFDGRIDAEKVKENDWFETMQMNNIYGQIMDLIQNLVGNFKSFIRPKEKAKPWYLADKKILRTKLDALKEITINPYISPLLYDDFDSLKDVNLYLIALHFDPFLDDNVSMAKKWRGKVSLDVLDELQHGFLNFMPFVEEAKKANLICIERLKEAIYC